MTISLDTLNRSTSNFSNLVPSGCTTKSLTRLMAIRLTRGLSETMYAWYCRYKIQEQGERNSGALPDHIHQNITHPNSMRDVKEGIEQLKNFVVNNPEIKYGTVSVTCNPAGNLILETHLANRNGVNNLIEIGVIQENFYDWILHDGKRQHGDFFNNANIQFAIAARDEIRRMSDQNLDGWTVKNFFDLVCEYKNHEFDGIRPDFYLDLLGSGESTAKYADPSSDQENQFHVKPPVLYKTREQLGVENVYVVEGPSLIQGKRFDANVIEGFFELLYQIAQGKKSFHISGHSRGAVAAIAINNLLVLLKQNTIKGRFTADFFLQTYLHPIKVNPADFFPAHILSTRRAGDLITDALIHSANLSEITIALTLSDPVQGPDTYGFNQNAFVLAKSLKLNAMHQRVDIIMGSQENSPIGFDLHLPVIENQLQDQLDSLSDAPCTIYKVNSNHKCMVEELHRKKRRDGRYLGAKTGSVEGHFSASVLSGRFNQIQNVKALVNNPEAVREIVSSYVNRGKVYAACAIRTGVTD